MDASQYKDYPLVLLFVKYVSDKYANDPDALIEVPPGGWTEARSGLDRHRNGRRQGCKGDVSVTTRRHRHKLVSSDVQSANDEFSL